MIDLDNRLAKEFLAECNEDLFTLEKELLAIENACPHIDEERVNRASRVVHSVRAGAYFLDLVKIAQLAQQTEDTLGLIREGRILPTPELVDVLLHATDRLHELVQDPDTSNHEDISDVMASLARVPDKPHPVALAGPSPETSLATSAHQARGRLRMLLVEDDFTSRLVLHTFLSRYGDCHVAVNGREAVEAYTVATELGQTYDLICMDIMMPEMDGPEALRCIRALESAHGIAPAKGARITMTTTVSDVRKVFQCFKERCDAYLVKPIDLSKLLDQMKSWHMVP
jgi:two-component system chemotaxis response regulator CheY